MNEQYRFLTDAQLKAEIKKCEFCEEKPCREACPAHCSPADFIMAAHVGNGWDYNRAAAEILRHNPLGGVCGVVCPDYHCMKACVHNKFDDAVQIPAVQAAIVAKAHEIKFRPEFEKTEQRQERIAVIGAGPAGLATAAMLSQLGYSVDIFEREREAGGSCNIIPDFRLPKTVLQNDIDFILGLGNITIKYNSNIDDPAALINDGYNAVVVSVGLWKSLNLNIENEAAAIPGLDYLKCPDKFETTGKVAVIGGGAVACDCALTVMNRGASTVEVLALEKISELPLPRREKEMLLNSGVEISGRTKVKSIRMNSGKITGLNTCKVSLPQQAVFHPNNVLDISDTEQQRNDIDHLIVAIGATANVPKNGHPMIFCAGDCDSGPSSVVEAVASGKNAALEVDAFLQQQEKPSFEKKVKSCVMIPGYNMEPVSLRSDFFGRPIRSPFLLSASPSTDGMEQMKAAYAAGWSGGIMKTAFDNVAIHIPGEYMHVFTPDTYGNCDNVSGHSLDRLCREIEQLVKLYPDRLTIGSTGGAVSGNDESDKLNWQGNTEKLENAGAMCIEYSLSCPQGGDGTEGAIVSQNARLTAKIIEWVLQRGDGSIPKLFKLTGAVTSIAPIVMAVKEVFDRYPDKKAGITLANSFPTLCFRTGFNKEWEAGIVVGMSGDGILPISYLTLASVSHLNVDVSGNGGPMNYKAAADFLALGARTVQFCTIVMKYGYEIHSELASGLSHLMQVRGIRSVDELIGRALPQPITDFMDLSPIKKISDCEHELCMHCGNCTRCPYQAIQLDDDNIPVTDASKCIGCSVCVQKCFSGALFMRDRTADEMAVLSET